MACECRLCRRNTTAYSVGVRNVLIGLFRPSENYRDIQTSTPRSTSDALGMPDNVGQKRPLKLRDIWAIRFYLDEHKRLRDRALFDLAIDSKLRGCDLVKIRIGDLMSAGSFRDRATVVQQKTGSPVQLEIVPEARKSLTAWLDWRGGTIRDFVFPSRIDYLGHLSTRQYARLVDEWVSTVGLEKREAAADLSFRPCPEFAQICRSIRR